ncbi:methylase [bacterium (Candidatus Blackallbacteria) CG17_big_fil_post_rev_8_21_14_2_50_48_46]|uniref:Methylase n=1 Tax=bacterium (Candidatus Blackallbacteria) CG17_big_fil_post_rev_8_21_14_2_50_48_46 TaxID=2014261 RepID=A0A2M7FZ48_9BACT|nr:MAG: methylase [bacterium (Candidatus Blackallbacteria) CG18_big_fil_WC_8_21_14_2_50_49_26]PIW14644.1 MAG: methylase [bacterium (Candidatus Blackallbacteria) CG17_big_fil_post_rev_8_21_14_2_50_48_46]PIW45695.1 MAG: methylase [bacterium (Candidatus Blackallbacteria) CG13_big_fil_rev_8_21_14_2_50_49_14]
MSSAESRYTQGQYLNAHPTWHAEDSPWKAAQILKMLQKHHLHPASLCEVGCGAGEVLAQLQGAFPESQLKGWDISPQAIELAQSRANAQLSFTCGDFLKHSEARYELLLALDVFEHVEDYFAFLRGLRGKADYTLFHIPLDLSAQAVLRDLLTRWRDEVGHLHYFTRELALRALQETGYEVLDAAYTTYAIDRPAPSLKARLGRWPRRLAFALNPDWAAKTLGGFCLLVLAR